MAIAATLSTERTARCEKAERINLRRFRSEILKGININKIPVHFSPARRNILALFDAECSPLREFLFAH